MCLYSVHYGVCVRVSSTIIYGSSTAAAAVVAQARSVHSADHNRFPECIGRTHKHTPFTVYTHSMPDSQWHMNNNQKEKLTMAFSIRKILKWAHKASLGLWLNGINERMDEWMNVMRAEIKHARTYEKCKFSAFRAILWMLHFDLNLNAASSSKSERWNWIN